MNHSKLSRPLVGLIALGALFVASGARAADAPAGAIDAAALWSKNCAVCHGKDAKGDTKSGKMNNVKDLTDPAVRAKWKRDDLIKKVKSGIKDEATGKERMKAFEGKLDDKQIGALVDYVMALK